MLTLGNELHASGKGHKRMRTLLEAAKKEDPTRLYAEGSNVHYGEAGCEENADFYSAFRYYGEDLRSIFEGMEGYLNHSYPGADHTYDEAMEHVRPRRAMNDNTLLQFAASCTLGKNMIVL